MAFGISFLDDAESKSKPDNRYQQAVEIRSLRLPRVVGGSALAPAPLLQGMGGSGNPIAQSAVAQALAQMAGMSPQGGPAPASAPMRPATPQERPSFMAPRYGPPVPRVIPGTTSPDDQARQPNPDDFGPSVPGWTPPPSVPEDAQAGPDPLSILSEMLRRKREEGMQSPPIMGVREGGY